MDIFALLNQIDNVSNSIANHWNFFSVVALGVATGVVITKKKIFPMSGYALMLGIAVFLGTNGYRIYLATTELNILESVLKEEVTQLSKDERLPAKLEKFYSGPYSRSNTCWPIFHILIDGLLLFIIWRRIEQDLQPPSKEQMTKENPDG